MTVVQRHETLVDGHRRGPGEAPPLSEAIIVQNGKSNKRLYNKYLNICTAALRVVCDLFRMSSKHTNVYLLTYS